MNVESKKERNMKKEMDMLRKLGALGDLPETRQVSLFDAFGEM